MQNEARVGENQTLLVSAASESLARTSRSPPKEFNGRRMKFGLMRIRHSWCPGAPCASPEIPPQEFKGPKMEARIAEN